MAIRAVIFDFGGVLVRTEDRTSRQQLAERLGMSYQELSEVVFDSETARQSALGEISADEAWEIIRKKLGLTPEELASMREQFWGGDVLDTELIDFLRELKGDYQIALLSNAGNDLRQALEEEWQISDVFDLIVISAEVGLAKPDPKVYQHILEQLGIEPHEAVFVDDFIENVNAASAAGMYAIHFKGSQQARNSLAELLERD